MRYNIKVSKSYNINPHWPEDTTISTLEEKMKRSEVTFYLVTGTLGAHACTCIAIATLQHNMYHGMIAMLSIIAAIMYTMIKTKGITLSRPLTSVSISLGWSLALFTMKSVETKNVAFIILACISFVASVLYVMDTKHSKDSKK